MIAWTYKVSNCFVILIYKKLTNVSMSLKSCIHCSLVFCKSFGTTYVPLNINKPLTFLDYVYPLPIILSYVITIVLLPKFISNLEPFDEGQEVIFSMWLFISQCGSITLIKWIYCFVQKIHFQQCLMDINQISIKFNKVNLIEKSNNNFILTPIIGIYAISIDILNINCQDNFWLFYMYALPLEIANFEQYLIYCINKEIYLLLNHINNSFASFFFHDAQNNIEIITKSYDNYKKVTLLTKDFNKIIGFPLLCSLGFTITGLITGCYQLKLADLKNKYFIFQQFKLFNNNMY